MEDFQTVESYCIYTNIHVLTISLFDQKYSNIVKYYNLKNS